MPPLRRLFRSCRQAWRREHLSARYPSYRVVYDDGRRSVPLMKDDAESRASLFGGVVEYARDEEGNLT